MVLYRYGYLGILSALADCSQMFSRIRARRVLSAGANIHRSVMANKEAKKRGSFQ